MSIFAQRGATNASKSNEENRGFFWQHRHGWAPHGLAFFRDSQDFFGSTSSAYPAIYPNAGNAQGLNRTAAMGTTIRTIAGAMGLTGRSQIAALVAPYFQVA